MRDHLQLYVGSLEAQGSHESEGSFTLAVGKARERFLTFQEQCPTYYLLRIFQAAVASGAPEVNVTFSRSEINLWFVGNLDTFSPEAVQAALVDPQCWDESPLGYLAMGLLCSVSSTTKVVWVESANRKISALVLSETESQVAPAELSHQPLECGSDFYLLRVQKTESWLSVSSPTAQEHSEALIRFQHAPIPVKLDSRHLEYVALPREAKWFAGLMAPRVLSRLAWSESAQGGSLHRSRKRSLGQ